MKMWKWWKNFNLSLLREKPRHCERSVAIHFLLDYTIIPLYKQPLTDADFDPELHQKGVDIKIGLDLAWISYNHIADRVIFITGDSDFIPAIKTARRNGIFVYLVTLNHMVRSELPDNCDVCNFDGIKTFKV